MTTRTRHTRRALAPLAALAMLLNACALMGGGDDEASDSETVAAEPRSQVRPQSPAERPAPATDSVDDAEADDAPASDDAASGSLNPAIQATGPGFACLGSDAGLTCLQPDGSWISYGEDNGLNTDYVLGLAACGDGSLMVATTGGINGFDGTAWQDFGRGPNNLSPDAVACNSLNDFWIAGFGSVTHFEDGSWTPYEATEVSTGPNATELMEDVDIAADGTIWVSSASGAAAWDGSAWTVYTDGAGFDDRIFVDGLIFDPEGRPALHHGDELAIFDGSAWNAIELPSSTVQNVAYAPDGTLYAGTFQDGLAVSTNNGGSWTTLDLASGTLSSDRTTMSQIDGAGRLWLGTEWGLTVIDNGTATTYRMDNAPLHDNKMTHLVVLGDGPTLPAVASTSPATVTGTIVDPNGAPVANTLVELCTETLLTRFSGLTPCSDQPGSLQTTTNGSGAFTFTDVPHGRYAMTIQGAEGWIKLTGEYGIGTERFPVVGDTDLPTITLNPEDN